MLSIVEIFFYIFTKLLTRFRNYFTTKKSPETSKDSYEVELRKEIKELKEIQMNFAKSILELKVECEQMRDEMKRNRRKTLFGSAEIKVEEKLREDEISLDFYSSDGEEN